MGNRAVGVALSAAALSAIAACATTAPTAGTAARAAAPKSGFAAIDFSDLKIAERFRFRAAEPMTAAHGADASYALPHESALGRGRNILSQYADKSHERAIMARVAENLPEGWEDLGGEALRHKASGLRCPVAIKLPEEQREFQLTEIRAFDQKNLDVGCNYSTGAGSDLTLYASFWPQMSLDDSAGGSVEAIMLRFQVKGQLPVAVAALTAEDGTAIKDLEKAQAAAFDIGEVDGVPYKTSLWIVKTQGWHVKARATYPQQDMTSEIVSAVMFAVAHIDVRLKNIGDPVAAGGEV